MSTERIRKVLLSLLDEFVHLVVDDEFQRFDLYFTRPFTFGEVKRDLAVLERGEDEFVHAQGRRTVQHRVCRWVTEWNEYECVSVDCVWYWSWQG